MTNKSYGESLMCQFLDILLPDECCYDNLRPTWLLNPKTGQSLEIDRFYPDLKVGFEFQGDQHLRPVEGMGDFQYRLYLDSLKKKQCKERGILLFCIEPIDLVSTALRGYAKKACRRNKNATYLISNTPSLKKLNQAATEYRKQLAEKYPDTIGIHRRKGGPRKEKTSR